MTESFRDRMSTVDEHGKRLWLYPRVIWGALMKYRSMFAALLLTLLVAGPFLQVNDQQLLLFNIPERKFIIFGMIFWPQDFHLFVLAMITFIVFIVLFTVVYGRLFCGWACPQTIFMEFVFRPIERLIEGNSSQRRKLDKAPWTAGKIARKTVKHILFYAVSFFIANIFLAYIIGSSELLHIISEPVSAHLTGFSALVMFSGVFYFVFGHFREQVCIIACPYGRLQGVMLDASSMVVAYDYKRGEPRAPFSRKGDRKSEGKGDCVGCQACVQVCPTGIDIRNGTQLECINCMSCIDACNSTMQKVGLPKGLIRVASEKNIAENKRFRYTLRMGAYTSVLVILLSVVSFLVVTRDDVESVILREYRSMYQEYGDDAYSNIYNFQVFNKTHHALPVELKLLSPEGMIVLMGDSIIATPEKLVEGKFLLILKKDKITHSKTNIQIQIRNSTTGEIIDEVETSFIGPMD